MKAWFVQELEKPNLLVFDNLVSMSGGSFHCCWILIIVFLLHCIAGAPRTEHYYFSSNTIVEINRCEYGTRNNTFEILCLFL